MLNSPTYNDIWHCKEVYAVGDGTFYYDENKGSVATLLRANKNVFDKSEVADIDFRSYPFYLSKFNLPNKFYNQKFIFQFHKGKLMGKTEYKEEKEFILVHLQKREMKNQVTNPNSFLIIPNEFLDIDNNFSYEKEYIRETNYEKKHPEYEESIYKIYANNGYHSYYQSKQEILSLKKIRKHF